MESVLKPSLIFDLLCLVLVLVVASRHAHKGLLSTIVDGVGTLVSLAGAWLVSGWASPQIFTQWFAPGLSEQVATQLGQGGALNLDHLISEVAGFLPPSVVQAVIDPIRAQLESAFSGGVEQMTQTLMDSVIGPLIQPIITGVVFFLVFVALRMLVSILANMLTHVNGIPLIGAANKSLGFVAGVAVGLLYLFLTLCAVWFLIAITGGQLPYLDDALLTGSIFYRIFGAINPFTV